MQLASRSRQAQEFLLVPTGFGIAGQKHRLFRVFPVLICFRYQHSPCPDILACTSWQKSSVQNCSPRSRPEVAKKSPSGGWGARGAGAFDLRDKNSSRDRRYNDRRAKLVPYYTNRIGSPASLCFCSSSASRLRIVCRSSSSVTRSRRRRYRLTFWHLMKRSMVVSVHTIVGWASALNSLQGPPCAGGGLVFSLASAGRRCGFGISVVGAAILRDDGRHSLDHIEGGAGQLV